LSGIGNGTVEIIIGTATLNIQIDVELKGASAFTCRWTGMPHISFDVIYHLEPFKDYLVKSIGRDDR